MFPPVLFIIMYCKCNLAFKTLGVLNSLWWPPGSSSSCCLILVVLVLKQQICRLSEGSWGLSGGYKHNPVALLLNFGDDERHEPGHPVPAGFLVLKGRPTTSCFDLALITISVDTMPLDRSSSALLYIPIKWVACSESSHECAHVRRFCPKWSKRDTWPDFPLMVDML